MTAINFVLKSILLMLFIQIIVLSISEADINCSFNSSRGILNSVGTWVGSCYGQPIGAACAAEGGIIHIPKGVCSAVNQAGDCKCVKSDGRFGEPSPPTREQLESSDFYPQLTKAQIAQAEIELDQYRRHMKLMADKMRQEYSKHMEYLKAVKDADDKRMEYLQAAKDADDKKVLQAH